MSTDPGGQQRDADQPAGTSLLADKPSGTPLLVGLDLHKTYGPTSALDGASISVRAGEIVAVMGASGSGKSTLLHCLAGIVTTDSGQVRYQDRELSAMSDRERSSLPEGRSDSSSSSVNWCRN